MPSEAISELPRAHLVIRPRGRWSAIRVHELWEFRDLLRSFAKRDIKLRYRQTALGVVWVVLQPLLAAGIFSFVFGRVAKLPSDGVPYIVFSYAGLVAWTVFSGVVTKASDSLVRNSVMVSKVYFPRMLLPLAVVGSSLIDFGVSLAMMGVLMAIFNVAPTPRLLLLPAWLFLTLALSLGLGLIASALSARYRDVQYILPVAISMLLYASPVAYSLQAVPPSLRGVVALNPLTGILEAFRWSLLGTGRLPINSVLWSISASMVLFVLGAFVFASLERDFADVI